MADELLEHHERPQCHRMATSGPSMILYHFTPAKTLPSIDKYGLLATVTAEHLMSLGQPVVFLTTNDAAPWWLRPEEQCLYRGQPRTEQQAAEALADMDRERK